MPHSFRRDPCELEPLEPRLLLSGDPLSAVAGAGLMDFIGDALENMKTQGPGQYQVSYILNQGGEAVALGNLATIEAPTAIFDVAVDGLLNFSGTVEVSAESAKLQLGSLASAEITDGPDADRLAFSATYTLANSTSPEGGSFSIGLDQVELKIAAEVVTAAAAGLTLSYSPSTGLETQAFSFTSIKANLATGPPEGATTIIDASGSGAVLLAEEGAAASISLTLNKGPSFLGQTFVLTGSLSLQFNTTGVTVTEIAGAAVDLPSVDGAAYVQVVVSNARLEIGGGSGGKAVLTAGKLIFEQDGATVTVGGQGMSIELQAGSSQIVKAVSDAIVMQFVANGFVAAVVGASVQGPQISGGGFELTGKIDFRLNTSGVAASLPGVTEVVPTTTDGSIYTRAEVHGATSGEKAVLTVGQSTVSATELVFERNDTGVSLSGINLSFELKAGAKRIVGVSGASFGFQFIQQGFYGALLDAAVQGPEFTDGSGNALFALSGTIALRVNTTTDPRTITVAGQTIDLAAGTAASPSIRVSVTSTTPPGGVTTPATLQVAGSSLTADRLEFVQGASEVAVFGDSVSLLLKAGGTRILGISNATFGFVFNASGFVGAMRNATVTGPEFTGFTLTGTAGLDINTTGATATLDGFGSITGVANDVYLKATVADAVLGVHGNELRATTLMFEKNGDAVRVGGTGTSLVLKTSTTNILTATSEAFFFQFTHAGFAGGVTNASVTGPQIDGFTLAGLVSVQINTTGAAVAVPIDLNGDGDAANDSIPGVVGGIYIKAGVKNGVLALGEALTMSASQLEFEWDGSSVTLGGADVLVRMVAGSTRIVEITNGSFAFTFTGNGFYGAMAGGTIRGPDLPDFELQGRARFLINTTETQRVVTVPGGESITINAATGDNPYRRIEIHQLAADDPAKLRIADNILSARKFVFEIDGSKVTLFGEGLVFTLMAGSTHIFGLTVESFYFQFSEIGLVGAVVNATATPPPVPGFTLQGVVTLLINTSGTDPPSAHLLPIDVTGDGVVDAADAVPSNPGDIYVKAIVKDAVLAVEGAGRFTAALLEFEYGQDLIAVRSENLSFALEAGGKRVVGLSGADFAFAIVEAGFYGALRNAAIQGPEISGFTLSGTVGLAINTTGVAQSVTLGVDTITLSDGGGEFYARVEVTGTGATTPATLTVAGAFSVTAELMAFEMDGQNVSVDIADMTLGVGNAANPVFELGGSLALRITPTQVEIATATLTFPGNFSLGGFLSITTPSFSLTNFVFVHSGAGPTGLVSGVVGFSATGASLFPGKTFGVSATQIEGSFNLISAAFSIRLGTFHLGVGEAFVVDAADVIIAYDPAATGPQELVSIGSGTLTVTPLNFSGTVSGLSIRTDGFSFGTLIIENTGSYTLGGLLSFSHVGIEINNFAVTYGEAIVFGGSITIFSGNASLFPGNTTFSTAFSSSTPGGRALQATFDFNPDGSFRSFIFEVDQFTLTLSSYLSASASGFTLDTGATGNEYLVQFGSIAATLTIPDIITIGGSAKNFAITAAGSFVTLEGFGFGFEVGLDKAASLKLPAWLPKGSIDLAIEWDDFVANPAVFKLDLSMSIDGKIPGADLELSGFVENLVIDIGLLIEGKFPIVSIGSVGVQAGGKIAGSEIQGGLFLAMLKLDADGNEIAPGSTTPVAQHVLYGGITGTLVVAGYGGLAVRIGLSQFGPLQGYVQAVVPIPVGLVTGFAITGLRAGITFGSSLPSVEDARELATDPGFKTSDELTLAEWRERLTEGVIAQVKIFNAIVDGSILDDPFGVLLQPIRIEGGASLINLYSGPAFRLDGDIILSTDGKLMIRGQLKLGGSAITIAASMFFDVSEALSPEPKVTALFLAEIPAQAKVVQVYGGIRFEYGVGFDPASVDTSAVRQIYDYTGFDEIGPDGTYAGINVENPYGTDLKDIRIFISGGVEISAIDIITLKIEGTAEITFSAANETFDFEIEGKVRLEPFNADLISLAGTLRLQIEHVEENGIQYEIPKFWGVFALMPAELTLLQDVGIEADAIAVLRLNSTTEARSETLLIPGQTNPITFEIDPLSLSVLLEGVLTFSFSGTQWFRLDGTYVYSWSADEDGGVVPELDVYIDAQFSAGPESAPWLRADALGYMQLSIDGIAAMIELDLDTADFLTEAGVIIDGSFLLVLNTTGDDVNYQVPTQFPDVQGERSVHLPRGPPTADRSAPTVGQPYFLIAAEGNFIVLDIFVLRGEADLLISPAGIDFSFEGKFALQVAEVVIHDFDARGGLRVDADGIAAGVQLTVASDISALGFQLAGSYLIEINTTGHEVTVGGVTLAQSSEAYARVRLDGALNIGSLSMVGLHFFQIAESSITVLTEGSLKVGAGTGAEAFTIFEFKIDGTFLINASGIAGRVSLSLAQDFQAPEWFQFDGTFALGINTTDQTYEDIPAMAGAKIFTEGRLTILNSLELDGSFNFVLSPTKIAVESDFSFSLKNGEDVILSFDVIYDFELTLPGIVLDVGLTFDTSDFPGDYGIDLEATFSLQVNTTGQAHGNLEAGIYARVKAAGDLVILESLELSGTFYFQARLNGLEMSGTFSATAGVDGDEDGALFALEGSGAFMFGLGGIGGRAAMTLQSGGSGGDFGLGAGLNATFLLQFNTSSNPITLGDGTIIAAGPSVRLAIDGRLVLPGITIEGVFDYEMSGEAVELVVNGTALVGLPDLTILTFLVEGRLRLDGEGFVGFLTQKTGAGTNIPGHFGASFAATFTIEVNTTGEEQTLGETPVAAGARVIADGRLDITAGGVAGLFLEGRFVLSVDDDSIDVAASASVNFVISGETLFSKAITGVLSLDRYGLVAQIALDFDMGLVVDGTGITFDSDALLEINTTGAAVTSIAGQPVNLTAGVYARLTVNGSLVLSVLGETPFRLDGTFRLTAAGSSVNIEANATLRVVIEGQEIFSLVAEGQMRLGLGGLVARIVLSRGSAAEFGGPGYSFNVTQILEINLTGQAVEKIGDTTVNFGAGPFVRVRAIGYLALKIDAQEVVRATGEFVIEGRVSHLLVAGAGNLVLKINGNAFLNFQFTGAFQIGTQGLAASFNATMSGGVPSGFGFSLSASSAVQVQLNTASTAVTLPTAGSIDPGYRFTIHGSLAVPGLTLTGTYTLSAGPSQLTVAVSASLSVFGATLTASGFAGIYYDSAPGIALSIQLRSGGSTSVTVIPVSGFSISGAFTLILNTTAMARANLAGGPAIPAQTLRIEVTNLSVNLFGFVLTGSLNISISSSGFSITIPTSNPLTLDFFGVASLQVSGHLNTSGSFSFSASASINIGNVDIFGFSGSINVGFSNSGFSGGLNGTFGAFGIKVSAGGSFFVDSGVVKISVHISLQITPAFSFKVWTPWKTYTVHVPAVVISGNWTMTFGALTTAPVPPPAPNLARVSGTTLFLNIGADAGHRGSFYPAGDESYSLAAVGPGSSTGQKLSVNALGYTQEYDNITHIVVTDTQGFNNFIAIGNDITATAAINVGKTVTGTNRFFTGGGAATVQGGSVSTTVVYGSGGGSFHAGTGQSSVTDSSGGNVTVYAPNWLEYSLTDASLNYGSGNGTLHTIRFTNVRNVILNGAANATYETSSLPDPSEGIASPWTGNATFNGTGSSSLLRSSTSSSITLSDAALVESGVSITLNNITRSELHGNAGNNTFTISGWSGTGSIHGHGGSDSVVATNDTHFTLSDTQLMRSGRGAMALDSVESATLTGGAGANQFTVSSWNGTASLDGLGGADTYTITLNAAGAGTTHVGDSAGSSGDLLTVNGTATDNAVTVSGTQVILGGETVHYSGIEGLTVNTLGGNDTVTISGTGPTTTINTGAGNDTLVVNGNTASLTLNGDADNDVFTINASAGALVINGGDGNDTIHLLAATAATTINTGTGTNAVHLGTATLPSPGTVNGIAGLVTIHGGGIDTVNVNDTADTAANTGTLTSTQLTGLGLGGGVTYNSLNVMNIRLGAGDDRLDILSTDAGTRTTLGTGAGADAINFGGPLNAILGLVIVDGQDGADTLNVDDAADSAANTGLLTSSRLTGLGMGDEDDGIEYAGIETLNINLGTGADTFNIRSTFEGAVTTLNTGANGANGVNVGSLAPNSGGTLNGIAGLLIIHGQSGSDTVRLDDSGDSGANTGLLTNNRVTGLGMGGASKGLQYEGVEVLEVNLGTGSDTLNVQSTNAGTVTTVRTGMGSVTNTINVGSLAPSAGGTVNAIAGRLTVEGQGGADLLNVDDRGDASANAGLLTSSRITGLGMADNDSAKGIEYTGIESLTIALGDGSDRFTVQTTHAGTTLLSTHGGADVVAVNATSGITTIDTGDGDDVVNVGSAATLIGNSGGTLNLIAGALIINGGAGGADILTLDDTADGSPNTGALSATRVSGLGMGSGGLTYSGLETITLNLGSAGDTLTIDSTHAGLTRVEGRDGGDQVFVRTIAGRTEIAGQSGADTITVGNGTLGAYHTLNGIQALLVLTGGVSGDIDTLVVTERDEAAADSQPGTLTATTLTGLGMSASGGINYTEFENLEVTLGNGNDHFVIATTHSGLTTLKAGAGNDSINIASLSGETRIRGEAGDDTMRVNVNADGTERLSGGATVNGVGAYLDLDGQLGSDTYRIYLAGAPFSASHRVSLINVHDSGGSGNGTDFMEVFGSDDAAVSDSFLIRRNFLALLPPVPTGTTPSGERINYDGSLNAGVAIYGRAGSDRFVFDDNGAAMTVDGGDGDDHFQLGQMFQSERISTPAGIATVAAGDEVRTLHTTQGYLTPGVTFATTLYGGEGDDQFLILSNQGPLALYGEAGDDRFIVRAFALFGSEVADPNRAATNINAGLGADEVEYNVNAPVAIDGGDGFDTIVVVGTEFSDRLVITADGIYGAGLFVTYVGIERIEIDGAEGDDHIAVLSTPEGVVTFINGSRGSDTFSVGGGAGPVVSRDLQGHSGIIENIVLSGDVSYAGVAAPGIAVDVADNDTPGVVLTPSGGGTTVAELDYGIGLRVDSYTVVLTAPLAAGTDVYVTVSPPLPSARDQAAGSRSVQVYTDAPNAPVNYRTPSAAIELHFTSQNWNQPQTVYVQAVQDGVAEGTRSGFIQHSISADSTASGFGGLAIANMPVTIIDADTPAVHLLPLAGDSLSSQRIATINPLLEGTSPLSRQHFALVVTGGSADVTLDAGSQFALIGGSTFSFAAGGPAQFVVLRALNDGVVEGSHHGLVTATAAGGGFAPARLEVAIADANSAGVLILPTNGSTRVIEGGSGSPATDAYSVVLTSPPAAGQTVTVRINPVATPTTNQQLIALTQGQAADPAVLASIVPQVSVNVTELTFTSSNWNTPQVVTVSAIDDAVIDGDGIQAFAPALQTVDAIRGPVIIDGDSNPASANTLPDPLLYIGENNRQQHTPIDNPNLYVIEADQIDSLWIYNRDAVAAQGGTLTSSRIFGLGMGGELTQGAETFGGGITYHNLEMVSVYLGKGADTFEVAGTHGGETLVDGGSGNDAIAVRTVAGHTTILGGAGNDSITLGAPEATALTLDRLRALVTVDGGSGSDTLNVDDRADATHNTGTVDTTTIVGLDMLTTHVATVTLQNTMGTFGVEVAGKMASGLPLTASAETVRSALLGLAIPGVTDVTVNRAGNVFTIAFLATESVLPGSLAITAISGPVDTFATSVPNQIQTISLTATSGQFGITMGATGPTFTITVGDSADQVRSAIITALNPGNVPAAQGGVGIRDVLVSKFGSTYEVVFQGVLSGSRGLAHSFSVPATGTPGELNHVAPISVAVRANGINYHGIETLNLDLGSGSDVLNIRGTTAVTNVSAHGGDDRVYVSSHASETQASAATTDFLRGHLDRIGGTLNLDLGAGRHRLMISDESTFAAKNNVRITDQPVAGHGLPPTEITITGLTAAPAITYKAAPSGNFADGITVWTGYGADVIHIDGTHQRGTGAIGSLRTVTTLNTGLGNDTVTVNLNSADGFFVLNTQGPESGSPGTPDNDSVDASASTRPLVIFGGQGDDTIRGGQGADIIFGDRGTVTYYDGTNGVAVYGNGGPGDRTDGVERPLGFITTTFPNVGGNDTVFGLQGRDYVFGGYGNDFLDASASDVADDILVGDNGAALFTNGFVTRVETTSTSLGGDDTLIAGKGANIAFGGVGSDTILAGGDSHPDILVGDNGTALFDPVNGRLLEIFTTAPADAGPDVLTTGDGNNVVLGGSYSDLITTGAGNDVIVGDNGRAVFDPITYRLVRITTTVPEQGTGAGRTVDGVLYDDVISAGTGNNVVFGGSHNDHITTLSGDDIVVGDNGFADFDPSGVLRLIESLVPATGGNDRILTGTGADMVIGGTGQDYIDSGSVAAGDVARDVVLGDSGRAEFGPSGILLLIETIAPAVGGDDTILIGGGDNVAFGGVGSDAITAGSGRDILAGDNGRAVFDPVTGTLVGMRTTDPELAGVDTIAAGDGDNVVFGGTAGDTITSGTGADVVVGDNGSATFHATTFTVANVRTSDPLDAGVDTIVAGGGRNIVLGGSGRDSITTGSGDDIVLGDNGYVDFVVTDADPSDIDIVASTDFGDGAADTINTGGGSDIVIGGQGGDTLDAGNGDNIVIGDNGRITSATEDANRFSTLPLTLGLVETVAFGIGGADSITTGSGNDIILGGHEGDTIHAGDGDNVVLGDDGLIDFVRLERSAATTGADTDASDIDLIVSTSTAAAGGIDVIVTGSGNDLVIGGRYADTMTDSGGSNVLIGDSGMIVAADANSPRNGLQPITLGEVVSMTTADGGEDVIQGGAGMDLIIGGAGSDTINGGAGDDIVFGDNARVSFSSGLLLRAEPIDNAIGGADTIRGQDGNDILVGGAYGDRVDGGAGEDLVVGDNAVLDRTGRVGNRTSLLHQALAGSLIYDTYGNALVNGVTQNKPGGSPAWADFVLTLLDHSFAEEAASTTRFGNDYLAGGPGDDRIFGGLGDDVIQGDGSIDIAVSAQRQPDGTLVVSPSVEVESDGDDYIEGNGGSDLIFGGLGQDDIIGGSSSLFGLSDRLLRPDGSDLIFGGAGTDVARNDAGDTSANGRARDADVIAGDNANIVRIVGVNGVAGNYQTFGHDNYGTLKIIPRAVVLLDYTPGGADLDPASAALDIGAGDEIHGESGNDTIYGQLGNDVLFGEGQDDDIIGGAGADWISGGTGDDGVLGDDGRIYTSRNGTAEPLYGIAAIPTGGLDATISTPGKSQQAVINVSGQLKKTAILEPFHLTHDLYVAGATPSNDIIFGGLGNDFLHGGTGDDAISGAEALPGYYVKPFNPGDILRFGQVRAGEFAAYDENNPMSKVHVDPSTYAFTSANAAGAVEFILNFVATEQDGDDVLFGDVGNDWLVGGNGSNRLYGGYGDDLLNVDNNHDTAGGNNNVPDNVPGEADLAFGGAGRDILIANHKDDRLIDWNGEFNSYLVPFSPFGEGTVSRDAAPHLYEFLYKLSASDGADPTRALKAGTSASRNGEPSGELGLVTQQDAHWGDQQGSPADPQPGNNGGGGGSGGNGGGSGGSNAGGNGNGNGKGGG